MIEDVQLDGVSVGPVRFLDILLDRDTSQTHEVHVTSVSENSGSVGLLGSYYANRRFTAYFPVTFEQWDHIIPFESYDQQLQQPKLFLEAVRLYYNRSALVTGKNAQWLLPITWPADARPDKLNETTANVYRIAAGFRAPVLPQAWCNRRAFRLRAR